MNILYVTYGLNTPPRSGMELNRLLLLGYLSKNHRCTILSLQLCNDSKEKNLIDILSSEYGIKNITLLNNNKSFTKQLLSSFFWGGLIKNPFLNLVQDAIVETKYDIVHVEGFALLPLLNNISHKNIIFSSIDAISLRQKRLRKNTKGALKKISYKAKELFSIYLEKRLFSKASLVHIHSHDDLIYLKKINAKAKYFVNSIMVPNDFINGSSTANNGNILKLLFLGNLSINHISSGLSELLNIFDGEFDKYNMELDVVGRSANEYALTIDKALIKNVKFFSWVNDYLLVIQQADIIVLPDKMGTGIKNRVLQAMALGKLVIGTSAAFQDIPITNHKHAVIVDDINLFKEELIYFEKRRREIERIGIEARLFVIDNNSQEVICKRWSEAYIQIINEGEQNI